LDSCKDVTLVFVREEAGGDKLAEETGADGDGHQKEKTDQASADGDPANADIAPCNAAKHPVEPVVELLHWPAAFDLGSEQHRAECRAQGQRVERRDDHRDGDGDGELLVELARDPRNEGGRHENRRQNDGNGDHWTGNLFHGPECRVLR